MSRCPKCGTEVPTGPERLYTLREVATILATSTKSITNLLCLYRQYLEVAKYKRMSRNPRRHRMLSEREVEILRRIIIKEVPRYLPHLSAHGSQKSRRT